MLNDFNAALMHPQCIRNADAMHPQCTRVRVRSQKPEKKETHYRSQRKWGHAMNRKMLVKIHLKAMWFSIRERWFDLVNISLPIFLVTGIVAGCVKFWSLVFGISI